MIQNTSFQKKVVYLGLIALLLIPLYMIGHPATGDPTSLNASPGGQLAQLRTEYDLAPSKLGEIDPASESMKLATLGMRGVAANILWTKANHYKKTEDWEKLVASVNQMAKLQPNFVSVWEFQSHNLSYNISVEHDDYKFRYLWVKKGIEFLLKGTRYNRKEPKLPWTVGWYTGQKFGRADEHRQFRVLFPEDQDFHNALNEHVAMDDARGGRHNQPDNWLTSRLWYNAAYTIVETGEAPIRGKAPHIFYTDGPKALMNYATAIETEGILGDIAEYAWKEAAEAWDSYGQRVVPHSTGIRFRLGDKEESELEATRLANRLDELVPGMREKIAQEKKDKLTPEQIATLSKAYEELTDPAEQALRFEAERAIIVSHMEVADRAPDDVKAAAFRLAKETDAKRIETVKIAQYREGVNYDYWQARCRIEQLPETVSAREDVFRAKEEMRQAKLVSARELFETAWQKWAGIFKEHTVLVNRLTEDDLVEDIQEYIRLLEQLDEELPRDFVLQDLLDKFEGPTPAETAESEAGDAEKAEPEKQSEGTEETPSKPTEEKSKLDPEKAAEDKPKADADADAAPEKPAEDKPKADSEADPEKPAEDKPEADADADPEKPAEDKPKADSEADPEKPAEDKPKADADADPEKPAEDKPKADADADPEKPAEDKPETDSESPAETADTTPPSEDADPPADEASPASEEDADSE